MRKFYEWLYGYSVSPIGTYLTFGDAAIYDGLYWYQKERGASSPMLSVQKFFPPGEIPAAAGYAAWRHRNPPWPYLGRLLNYVLADNSQASPATPVSKIYPDGGGFFWEANANDNSLMGALWNVASEVTNTQNWHSHKDVNAVVIYGYGQPILVNSGYGGDNPDVNYTLWTARSSNVVRINQMDHQDSKVGDGITEGFAGNLFDYASGDSGTALPNGRHLRNYVFVHPQDGKNGYFVLFDEVTTTSGSSLEMILHPNSTNVTTVAGQQEYKATIQTDPHFTDTAGLTVNDPDTRSPCYAINLPATNPPTCNASNSINPSYNPSNQVGLSVFYGTSPSSVSIQNGWIADWNFWFTGRALYANYSFPSNKNKKIVTVLFPSDSAHAKALFERISGSNYSGATIDHDNGIVDTALENSSGGSINVSGVSFQGLASLYRKSGTATKFY